GLLTVEGELDDISGSGQTAAAHDLCTGVPASDSVHYEAKGAGHYGIFSGRRWREMVYPVVKAFIADHQASPRSKAKATTARKAAAPARKASAPARKATTAAPRARRTTARA